MMLCKFQMITQVNINKVHNVLSQSKRIVLMTPALQSLNDYVSTTTRFFTTTKNGAKFEKFEFLYLILSLASLFMLY